MTRLRPIPVVAGALLLAAIVQPAAAQSVTLRQGFSADSTKAATDALVPYADLDPASSAGARALLQRIEAAADLVCDAARAATDEQQADYRECRRMAVTGAVARMRSPALTELATRRRTELRAAR